MKKALLALLAVTIMASLAPAHAASVSYTRTIVSPTTFGSNSGVISLPSILPPNGNPTNPNAWKKMNVRTNLARCAYLKGGANSQDATTGKLGYVFKLPAAFSTGDSFSLTADAANAQFDFDVYFVATFGACLPDNDVWQQAATECVVVPVPVEGDAPKPPANIAQETQSSDCAEDAKGTIYPKSIFTRIGNEPTEALTYNAQYAIVVMPVGANGKFTLKLNGV